MAEARDPIISKAIRTRESCRHYLAEYFSKPAGPPEVDAKRIAKRALRRLESAIKMRNLQKIVAAKETVDQAMVYLWAVKQFPKRAEKQ